MIKFTSGNILESTSKALVNTVNCEGYMGKGIAYQFKLKFPKNNDVYVDACRKGEFRPGDILVHSESDKIIVNFPTKDTWRRKSEYDYITSGLKRLVEVIKEQDIKSISIPPLGCGNGGLDWERVKQLLVEYMTPISDDCEVTIYEPFQGSGNFRKQKPKSAPKINTSHLMLMMLKLKLKRFNKLRIQKAAYLINVFSGQDYFKFSKNHFGPHAYSVDILSRDIKEFQSHHNITTGEALERSLQTLVSEKTLTKLDNFIPFLEKSADVVNSFDDDRQLELFSTVIYLLQNHRELSVEQLIDEVHEWNEHKKKTFDDYVIKDMAEELEKLGIIRRSLLEKYELAN